MNQQFINDVIESVVEKIAAPKFIKRMRQTESEGRNGDGMLNPTATNKLMDMSNQIGTSYSGERQFSKGPIGRGTFSKVYKMFNPQVSQEFIDDGVTTNHYPVAKKVSNHAVGPSDSRLPTVQEAYKTLDTHPKVLSKTLSFYPRIATSHSPKLMAALQRASNMVFSAAPNEGIKQISEFQKKDKDFYDIIPQKVKPDGNIYQPLVNNVKTVNEIDPHHDSFKANDIYSETGAQKEYPGIRRFLNNHVTGFEAIDSGKEKMLGDLHGQGNFIRVDPKVNQHINPELHGEKAIDFLYNNVKNGPYDSMSQETMNKLVQRAKSIPRRLYDDKDWLSSDASLGSKVNSMIMTGSAKPVDALQKANLNARTQRLFKKYRNT